MSSASERAVLRAACCALLVLTALGCERRFPLPVGERDRVKGTRSFHKDDRDALTRSSPEARIDPGSGPGQAPSPPGERWSLLLVPSTPRSHNRHCVGRMERSVVRDGRPRISLGSIRATCDCGPE